MKFYSKNRRIIVMYSDETFSKFLIINCNKSCKFANYSGLNFQKEIFVHTYPRDMFGNLIKNFRKYMRKKYKYDKDNHTYEITKLRTHNMIYKDCISYFEQKKNKSYEDNLKKANKKINELEYIISQLSNEIDYEREINRNLTNKNNNLNKKYFLKKYHLSLSEKNT